VSVWLVFLEVAKQAGGRKNRRGFLGRVGIPQEREFAG